MIRPATPADATSLTAVWRRAVEATHPFLTPDAVDAIEIDVDALYEWRCKLLIAADAPPEQLYEQGDGRFEFERTVSRLMEMQSADYLAEGHGLRA